MCRERGRKKLCGRIHKHLLVLSEGAVGGGYEGVPVPQSEICRTGDAFKVPSIKDMEDLYAEKGAQGVAAEYRNLVERMGISHEDGRHE